MSKKIIRKSKRIKTSTRKPGSRAAGGSAPVFALSYGDLQEIHALTGMVCGWRMNLPKEMIRQAKEVHRRMIDLNRIDQTQRKRMKEAKAFLAWFDAKFSKAQNEKGQR